MSTTVVAFGRAVVARALAVLPRGNAITPESWRRRHRAILTLAWLHVPALYLVGVQRGYGLVHPFMEVLVVATFAAGAGFSSLGRNARASLATMALVSSSGILVHMTGGLVEMHFHFFVVVAVVALYQSWFPFLVAIGFVLLHHGVIGGLDSTSVYNHPAALRDPWRWAALHALFIAGESAAALTAWKFNELSLEAERAARSELEGAVADLSEAQALTHIGTWDWDVASNHLVWSDETYRICGVSGEFEPTFERFMNLIVDEEREEVREIVERALTMGGALEYECHLGRPDGSVRLVQGLGRTIEDGSGTVRLVGTVQDVTERKQALHDALTGLPNRTLFLDRVEHARTQQQRDFTTLALLFVDLDDFKTVNDTKGHLVGDAVLREVGKKIGAVLRPGDTIARLGGDEFVILLNGVEGAEDVTAVADRVLGAVAPAGLVEEIGVIPSASIGIVVEPAPGSRTAAELLRDADIAMYSAKRNSKGRWEIFDPTMGTDVQSLHTLRSDLRRAMDEEALFLQYQPIVRLSDGAMEGVEALVRWRHPERGVVPPMEFIPIAEGSGQIVDLGHWVLRRACRDAARWQDRSPIGSSLPVSVNVSPLQLRDPRFVEKLTQALSESELPPDRLVLEITEGVLVHEGRAIDQRLRDVRDLGVQLAIDGFGTGYSPLGYLHRFPIDRLKIDKVFIDSVTEGARAAALARAVVHLGHTLDLHVVAEGVESRGQADVLREMGCALAQGFLFSRPVDAHEIDAMLGGETWFAQSGPSSGLEASARPA
jgi:diguanylate cyclase (GGDEF)-like protein/PAS domain S-box-containing protein